MIIIIRKKIQLVESLLENSGLKDLLLKVKTISDETLSVRFYYYHDLWV